MGTANDKTDRATITLRKENRDADIGVSLKPAPTEDVTIPKNRIGGASGNDKENTPCPNSILSNMSQNDFNDQSVSPTRTKEFNTGTTTTTTAAAVAEDETATPTTAASAILSRSREVVAKEISKQVLRHKLQKLRHLVLKGVISPDYLDHEIFHPKLLELFDPQTVVYNGGIANVKEWKISCYLEVMEGGIPCTNPNLELLEVFRPLLDTCDDLFLLWYKQQHACNHRRRTATTGNAPRRRTCRRLMTFVTRYTPAPGEQALLKHVDGAGKVDGSCVVALPVDRWSAGGEEANSWIGHGGGLTFWDGREAVPDDEENDEELPPTGDAAARRTRKPRFRPREIHYETRSGDLAFIDRAVWHQADPITKGTRWALVIFYKVTEEDEEECATGDR